MAGTFRYTVWDPFMILCQMATLQCAYYVSLGLWIFFFDVIAGIPRSLDHIFKYEALLTSTHHGKLLVTAFFFNALACSAVLWQVVQRTKQCLDFTCTVHFFHIIICWIYNGYLGNTFSWWVINFICVAFMCVSGEYLCMRTELRAIPVSMSGGSQKVDL